MLIPFLETRAGCGQIGWTAWLENNCENKQGNLKKKTKHLILFFLFLFSKEQWSHRLVSFGNFAAEQTTGAHGLVTHDYSGSCFASWNLL